MSKEFCLSFICLEWSVCNKSYKIYIRKIQLLTVIDILEGGRRIGWSSNSQGSTVQARCHLILYRLEFSNAS